MIHVVFPKILSSIFPKCMVISLPSRTPRRGASANRHDRWAQDAMDAKAVQDERGRCGRRNRVVLISRRWDQVCRDDRQSTVARKAGHRGEHDISRKTIAQGMSDRFDVLAVTNSRTFYPRTRGCRCVAHPAFPAPSLSKGRHNVKQNSGVLRRENASCCPCYLRHWLFDIRTGARAIFAASTCSVGR